ncbi:protein lifeguard 2a [Hypanus sabinus]|uniref:protein lifeguard 2a n=1 Tax=Hypanus sabinus TaxID=79690 RepID=UPI0028C4B6F9|nr:protein lifeguard 2a [Hypanus sabinus]
MHLPSVTPSYNETIASREHPITGHQPVSTDQQTYPMQQPYSLQQLYPGQQPTSQHPNWVFAQPGLYPGSSSGYVSATFSPYSQPSNSESIEASAAEAWNNQIVRHRFVRKVYAILMVQLLITFGIVAVFMFCDPVKRYVHKNIILYYTSFGIFISVYLVLACCTRVRRCFPWNLILLSIFTLSMSYMAGMLTTYHNTKIVLLCIGITALVCFTVTIFSFQTKFDFTTCHGLLFGLTIALLLTGLVMGFTVPFGYLPWLHIVYAGLGAIAFTLFLAYDTQLLVGNKRYSLSPEEYIFAALCLYVDIVFIFIFFLEFGNRE